MSHALSGAPGRATIPDGLAATLRATFVGEAGRRLQRLRPNLPALLGGSMLAARSIAGDLHAIAGSASLAGEPELGWSARACEELIVAFAPAREIPDPVLAEVAFLLDDVVVRLTALVRSA